MFCQECEKLLTNNILEGNLNRIKNGVHANYALVYQPMAGLVELVRQKNQKIDNMWFSKLTISKKLSTCARALDDYKRYIMALSKGKVQRIGALIWAGLHRGAGIHGLLKLHDQASKGCTSQRTTQRKNYCRALRTSGLVDPVPPNLHTELLVHQVYQHSSGIPRLHHFLHLSWCQQKQRSKKIYI